jgi:hypothetical protein
VLPGKHLNTSSTHACAHTRIPYVHPPFGFLVLGNTMKIFSSDTEIITREGDRGAGEKHK